MTLPNFFVIGAGKSGTTSLWRYLEQHPEVYMSAIKEPNFFTFEGGVPDFRGPRTPWAVTDLEAYRALFAGVSEEKAIGEASAYYLYSEEAPKRIRHHVPDAKLVAVLRNPVDRAYSHFLYRLAQGGEGLTDFAQALDAEEERVRERWGPSFHYKRRGFYHEQLSRYYDLFGPEQIRVYLYEDLKEDPVGMTQSIFRFLGVDDAFVPDTSRRHNVARIPRSRALQAFIEKPNPFKSVLRPFLPKGLRKRIALNLRNRNLAKPPPMPEGVREGLTEAYREDILKLQKLVGRDLSGWLSKEA